MQPRQPILLSALALTALALVLAACDDGGGEASEELDTIGASDTTDTAEGRDVEYCTGCPAGTGPCLDPTAAGCFEISCGQRCVCSPYCPDGRPPCADGQPDCEQLDDGCGGQIACGFACDAEEPECCSGEAQADAVCGADGTWSCPTDFTEDACCADVAETLCCAPNGLQAYAACQLPNTATCGSWGDLDTSGCTGRRDACDGVVGFRCCSDADGSGMPVCHPAGYLVCPDGQKPVDPNETCE